ncbi:MAG: 2Fe-2S iron-sulfur cluster-binding protein [Gammaproteobacteria bacterium]|nr:2Fe-2S iron-sulfur cluster-binding protein [Gammaproteobacteria bacterium]
MIVRFRYPASRSFDATPPRPRYSPRHDPHSRSPPSGRRIENHPDESLLQSALNAGLAVDYGCSNGNCGKCRARLVSGEIERLAYSDFVFREDEKADGWFLMCCHRAASDVVIDTSLAGAAGIFRCRRSR